MGYAEFLLLAGWHPQHREVARLGMISAWPASPGRHQQIHVNCSELRARVPRCCWEGTALRTSQPQPYTANAADTGSQRRVAQRAASQPSRRGALLASITPDAPATADTAAPAEQSDHEANGNGAHAPEHLNGAHPAASRSDPPSTTGAVLAKERGGNGRVQREAHSTFQQLEQHEADHADARQPWYR